MIHRVRVARGGQLGYWKVCVCWAFLESVCVLSEIVRVLEIMLLAAGLGTLAA